MSLLGNLSEPITREDLLNLGWERVSKNTLVTQINISPQYYDQDRNPRNEYSWYSYNYWTQPVYFDVKRRMMRIRGTIYENINDMMELNMIIESYTNPKIEVKCK